MHKYICKSKKIWLSKCCAKILQGGQFTEQLLYSVLRLVMGRRASIIVGQPVIWTRHLPSEFVSKFAIRSAPYQENTPGAKT